MVILRYDGFPQAQSAGGEPFNFVESRRPDSTIVVVQINVVGLDIEIRPALADGLER